MVRMEDFRKEDGQIDWDAYRQAEIDAGEKCHRCGAFIFRWSTDNGQGPRSCNECSDMILKRGERAEHKGRIRCPHCTHEMCTDFDLLEGWSGHDEDEFPICCHECEKDFDIQIRVDYTFISPPCFEEGGPVTLDEEVTFGP